MYCKWCEENEAHETKSKVYWELPDGSRAIEIFNVPGIRCKSCGIEYQEDEMVEKIEDQLFLIDTTKIDKKIIYEKLMEQPRLLKRNYFKFD